MAKFSMKSLCKYSNVVEIVWYHQEHTHKKYGSPTHGTFDLESQSWKSQYVNCISVKLKAWIQEWFDNSYTIKQIYKEHKKIWYHACFLRKEAFGNDFFDSINHLII
jgi:hypothetical protein